MEVHRITLYVVDFDQIGLDGACDAIVNARYPNRCISPSILEAKSADVGEWSDEHPLNHSGQAAKEVERLFSDFYPTTAEPGSPAGS